MSERSPSLLFLTSFGVLVANPKKLLYKVASPARGLLNREKRKKKKKSGSAPPPSAHVARSEKCYTLNDDDSRPRSITMFENCYMGIMYGGGSGVRKTQEVHPHESRCLRRCPRSRKQRRYI